MGESTVNKETLAAGKHKKPERKQSIRDQREGTKWTIQRRYPIVASNKE